MGSSEFDPAPDDPLPYHHTQPSSIDSLPDDLLPYHQKLLSSIDSPTKHKQTACQSGQSSGQKGIHWIKIVLLLCFAPQQNTSRIQLEEI